MDVIDPAEETVPVTEPPVNADPVAEPAPEPEPVPNPGHPMLIAIVRTLLLRDLASFQQELEADRKSVV